MLPTPSPRKVFRAHGLRARILAPHHSERAAGQGPRLRGGADGRGGTQAVPARAPARRGAARERPVSHRPQHGVGRRRPRRRLPARARVRRSRRPQSFASLPSAARRCRPARPDPRGTYPARRGRAAAPRLRLLLVADSGPSLTGGVGAQGGRRDPDATGADARSLAGDFTAPPVPADNGRPGWLPSCARTGAPSLKRPARARARAHPPCPFFPVPSPRPPPWPAPPFPPTHATGSRGGALGRGHTR